MRKSSQVGSDQFMGEKQPEFDGMPMMGISKLESAQNKFGKTRLRVREPKGSLICQDGEVFSLW